MDGSAASAAILDLDRTVLRGASGPVLEKALRDAGVSARRLPGSGFLFRLYDLMGETLPSMAFTRAAPRVARGREVELFRQAGELAVAGLGEMVNPYVGPVMSEHRRKGRLLVLATTTPRDLVAPFASSLGFDEVVATRWEERGGRYTGRVEGEFVWSAGKLAAVRRFAAGRGIDLQKSYAYSDSIYDLPLLGAVGHPVAVNPDPRLWLVALAARWPVRFLDAPAGVPKLAGVEPFDVLGSWLRPELFPYARFDLGPVATIPGKGPAIVVSNHRSYFDVVALGLTVMQTGRPLRFLGKREVFDAPVVGQMATALGGIRVERGSGSDEPLRRAAEALEAGELVAVLPQGTIPRGRAFFDPVLRGKTGAARLAAMTGAPVVPVGIWGTEAVWPRSSRVPRVTKVLRPPLVRTRVGPPVDLSLEDPVADTEAIMAAIVGLLPEEAHRWREPTPEELALTVPPGTSLSDGDEAAEPAERGRLYLIPGTDAAPGSASGASSNRIGRNPGRQGGAKGAQRLGKAAKNSGGARRAAPAKTQRKGAAAKRATPAKAAKREQGAKAAKSGKAGKGSPRSGRSAKATRTLA